MFEIYADYGTTNETKLAEFVALSEAIKWVDENSEDSFAECVRIEVITFDGAGSEIVWYDVQSEQEEGDGQRWPREDDGQPSTYEEYQDLYGGDDSFESYYED